MRLLPVLSVLLLVGCGGCRSALVSWFSPGYKAPSVDAQKRTANAAYGLSKRLQGFAQPTDMQFEPGSSTRGVILEKGGGLHRFDIERSTSEKVHQFSVVTDSEMGLLGWAYHPKYPSDPRVFVNRNIVRNGSNTTRIASFAFRQGRLDAASEIVLLDVTQPYPNHNAGQLSFGPDGYLYIGFGDGGWRDDPGNHGQNPGTLLGSIIRVDVSVSTPAEPYRVPPDNPFIAQGGARPETFVYGVRNPWKFSFSPDGRLIVADVGQDKWEEVSIVKAGDNLGWKRTEGNNCFAKSGPCELKDYAPAFAQYGHDLGQSVTGGYVYTGQALNALRGQYIFADFVSGRVWSAALPSPGAPQSQLSELGQFSRLISSFGRADDGTLYLLDFAKGEVLSLVASTRR